MTSAAESPAAAERIRAVAFLPSNRDDCIATARMTFEEYLQLDYEGGLAEWVDGEVRLYMSTTNEHQKIVDFLVALLHFHAGLTTRYVVRSAGYAIRAAPRGSGREPDVMAVLPEHRERIRSSHLVGAPDIVFEVTSQDSPRRDRVEKFAEYEAAGIPEYWIIDSLVPEPTIEAFALRDGRYARMEPRDGAVRSLVLEGFFLRPEWFVGDELDAVAALEAILGKTFR